MNNSYEVTLVIIGLNERPTLEKNFRRLEAFALDSGISLQVVYVDSNSSDGSVQLACQYRDRIEGLSVIKIEGQTNAAIARNAGIKEARGEYLLFLDGDIVFETSFLTSALEVFEKNPKAGALTGKLQEVYDINAPEQLVERTHGSRGKCRHLGGNFIARASTVRETGFFDETLRINEDIDFSVRIFNRNLELIELGVLFGVHYTEPYNQQSRLSRDLATFYYVYPGILLRKYLFSRGFMNVVHSQLSIYLRFATVAMTVLGLVNPLFLVLPLAIFLLLVVRVKKHLQETVASRALSFLKGVQVGLGLFWIKPRPRYQLIRML